MKLLITLIVLLCLLGCDSSLTNEQSNSEKSYITGEENRLGVSVKVINQRDDAFSFTLKTLAVDVSEVNTLQPGEKRAVKVVADDINDAIKTEHFSLGDLTIWSVDGKHSYEVCGYIEVATNKVCGQSEFVILID